MPRVAKPKTVQGLFERKKGSGMWSARFTQVDKTGKLQKYVKAFGTDKQGALMWLKLEPGRVREAEGKQPIRTSAATVGDLCDAWLRYVLNDPDHRDKKNPVHRVKQIKAQFGSVLADQLKPREIREWLGSLDIAPATWNRIKHTLSAIYRHNEQEDDAIIVNPARRFKARRIVRGIDGPRCLEPEEETRIRAVLQADIAEAEAKHGQTFTDMRTLPDGRKTPRTRYRDYSQEIKRLQHRVYEFDISLLTGLRKSEQYGLTWGDIDFKRRTLTIRNTKNGTDHVLPMTDELESIFKAIRALELFRKDRAEDKPNPAPADSVFSIGDNGTWWDKTLVRAKVENYRWHDNRHTFCSRLVNHPDGKISLIDVKALANHRSVKTTEGYVHEDRSRLVAAMESLNRRKTAV